MLRLPEEKSVLETFSLKGKVALVTGGNRGIGLDVSRGLAQAGAHVAIIHSTSKSAGNAQTAAASIAKEYTGSTVKAYQADVADPQAIETAIQNTVRDFGGLDIVVANAGVGAEIDAVEYPPGKYRELMSVNLDGAFYTAQVAAKFFKRKQESRGGDGFCGNIIFTTSISAVIVNRPESQAIYNASKAGLVHLAKSLAIEWMGFCRVNCISPGYIATDMIEHVPEEWSKEWIANSPSKRFGKPYELKGAYVFCASDASSFMTGAHIIVDGGFTLQ